MKKTTLLLVLMTALTLQAQTTRLSVHLGGGASTNFSNYDVQNLFRPMGSLDLGFSYISADNSYARYGIRTGMGVSYSQVGFRSDVSSEFTNYDYDRRQIDYTIRARVNYFRNQLYFNVPVMFLVMKDGFSFNVGCRLMLQLYNNYTQEVVDPTIAAYYPLYGVTVTNDIATGMVSDEQMKVSGKASLPRFALALSAEIGYVWEVGYNSRLGFDIYFDYSPVGTGGNNKGEVKQPIEVGPIVNDAYQPHAPVTVNLLSECGGDKWNYLNIGIRMVYAFDFK